MCWITVWLKAPPSKKKSKKLADFKIYSLTIIYFQEIVIIWLFNAGILKESKRFWYFDYDKSEISINYFVNKNLTIVLKQLEYMFYLNSFDCQI